MSYRLIIVFVAGLRDLDWDGELVRIGIFERGRRLFSFIIDIYIGDGIVLVSVWDIDDVVCILSGSGIEWSSCVLAVKLLSNDVWILRDWCFLSTVPTDLLRSGENYIKK